jgi:hypothetical protein
MRSSKLSSNHVVALHAGLGNQLFQYSWALHLMKYLPVRFDLSAFRRGQRALELEDLGLSIRDRAIRFTMVLPSPGGRLSRVSTGPRTPVGPPRLTREDPALDHYDMSLASWWYGYWEDRDMALEVIGDIRGAIRPVEMSPGSIGVHVRRGDFVERGLDLEAGYYSNAVQMLQQRYRGANRAVVYSDDPAWCRRELQLPIEVAHAPMGSAAGDMLSLASHEFLVLSRGTFGWWASHLSDRNPETVVAPHNYRPGDSAGEAKVVDPRWLRAPASG